MSHHAQIWTRLLPLGSILIVTTLAYGGVWTRGIMDDDYCMGMHANTNTYLDGVGSWLEENNSRLFLAILQTAIYRIPLFSDPVSANWVPMHLVMVGMHLAICTLVYRFLLQAGVAVAPALAAALVFGVHPMISQPVLWPAAAFGYVLGTLLVIGAVASYLRYEKTRSFAWLSVALVQGLLASLGIEQFICALGHSRCSTRSLVRGYGLRATPSFL